MRKPLLIFTALVAGTLLADRPTQAYVEGPWCFVTSQGKERCDFRDFAACQQEIATGGRGFCNQNPRWSGSSSSPTQPRRRNRQ
jgi:hypothetical protein